MISLVIDANILFSAFYNKLGTERQILDLTLDSHQVQLLAPDIFKEEISRNLIKKLGFSAQEIQDLFSVYDILQVPIERYRSEIHRAQALIIHENDVPYVAVSLLLNCPIWSGNTRHFQALRDSPDIIWFTTSRLKNYLRSKGLLEASS